MPTWSNVIGCKFTEKSSTDANSHCRMNLTRDAVLTESPNFVNLGISFVHRSDELESVFIPINIIRTPTDGSNWLLPGHRIDEVTAYIVSRTGSEQDYNAKNDFENRRENQYFGRKYNSMSRPSLDSTPLGTNTTNGTTSPIDSIPFRPKTPEPTPLT